MLQLKLLKIKKSVILRIWVIKNLKFAIKPYKNELRVTKRT